MEISESTWAFIAKHRREDVRDVALHANIAVRNFPLTVAQLRKKLKLKDGGNTYLFATTDAQGRHLVLRTKKRKNGSL